ncbi:Krueppel homolog 2 [Neodiprion pinetum]|uniref:Krueppel homolog 2 n=1 Tax=Neodiprion lecontei TaxID=441921 RepID=A0A6J0BDZ8_NEOLC|nr:Krueppel homolog 2 [Neodiprion lecontei]XP_046422789.1 Krueppel homolog 2 [Neodiprion fabricii]XP_046422790.1 Krueppel homolog 2 [Neodiprion fabricii]XP_046475822.1 Krueppel homolog 2 [Neodiprion pinetum]XP_046475823.1 Krueppel homolog 2 [Neodiprion pinetum]XP_046594257.1 Krueppel homolog 2 [Neodiprion lecontei]XP_046616643.1 Krueppel homolog 2 [Neodiprion virginianus]XP_046616644.1 Krueppel homolog 2 [Neodiprion virginianus]
MADTASNGSGDRTATPEKGWENLKQHVIDNKISVGLWATRVLTILFTVGYIIPIFGNPYNAYYKILMCNAATSALRLHQRLPRVQFSREFWTLLVLEDSCHNLFYSLIFLYVAPASLVIAPVLLFAILHSASYSLTLLDCLGQNSWWGARLLISLVEFQSRNILRLCAICEALLLPYTILLILNGRAGLLTPFIYYQFLALRLSSRRNPFTRNLFREISNSLSVISNKPGTPAILKRAITFVIGLIQNMSRVP